MTDPYHIHALRLKALAHPVRLHILDMLRQGEVCVCHLEAALKRRQAYVSQQLMILREAGLVEARKDGLQVFYRITDPSTEAVLNTLLGPCEDTQITVIDHCPCPSCATQNAAAD